MLIVTIMLIIIFGLILFFTQKNMEQESIQMLRSISMMPMQPDIIQEVPDKVIPMIFTISKSPDGKYIAKGSEIVYSYDNQTISDIFNIALESGEQTGIIKQYNLRFFVQSTPMFQSIIFTDISSENAMLVQLVKTCIFIAIISFGIFFVISILLAKWTVKPIETAWNEQKQFVADASHELKTPLTVIMTNAEMLLDNNHSEIKRKQFSENILTMSRQMKELTENLLELARNDNHSTKIIYEYLNFSDLISDSVLPFEPLYFEKKLNLICRIQPDIFLNGNPNQLLRLADILLDNALKYSYPDTKVLLELKSHGNSCIFSVTSHGETISKEDLKNIFRRFYRIDKVRSMNHSYGIGLAIAKNISQHHNGKIWAESLNNINTFYVKLPLKCGYDKKIK